MTLFETYVVEPLFAVGASFPDAVLPLTCLPASSSREKQEEERWPQRRRPTLPACGERVRLRGSRNSVKFAQAPS
jgi:hypothetical protein